MININSIQLVRKFWHNIEFKVYTLFENNGERFFFADDAKDVYIPASEVNTSALIDINNMGIVPDMHLISRANEEHSLTMRAKIVWMLHNFMMAANDEEWYCNEWITLGPPDGCSEEAMDDFLEDEPYQEVCELFTEITHISTGFNKKGGE